MKKIVSVVLAVLVCLSLTACPAKLTEEEKFQKQKEEWLTQIDYEEFKLFEIYLANDYTDFEFWILSSDNVIRKTISFEYESDEVFELSTMLSDVPSIYVGEYLNVTAVFETEKFHIDKVPQNLSFTLSYTTTDGEEVSKDYVLDFTQTPFWDYRTGTGLYQP